MKGDPEERAVALGQYVVETGATVRAAAQKFGISKSTVHMEVTKLNGISGPLNEIVGPPPSIGCWPYCCFVHNYA